MSHHVSFTSLPVEVIIKIIAHLGPADINALAGVNAAYSYLVNKVVCLVTDKTGAQLIHKNIHTVYPLETPPETLKATTGFAIIELHKTKEEVGYAYCVSGMSDVPPAQQVIVEESKRNILKYAELLQSFTNVMRSHVVAYNLVGTTNDYASDMESALAQIVGSKVESLELLKPFATCQKLRVHSVDHNVKTKPLSVLPRGVSALEIRLSDPDNYTVGAMPVNVSEVLRPSSMWDRLETLEVFPIHTFNFDVSGLSFRKLQRLVVKTDPDFPHSLGGMWSMTTITDIEAPCLKSFVVDLEGQLELANIQAPALEHATILATVDAAGQFYKPGISSCFLSVQTLDTTRAVLLQLGQLPNVVSLNVESFGWPTADQAMAFGASMPKLENVKITKANEDRFFDGQSNWLFQGSKKLKTLDIEFREEPPSWRSERWLEMDQVAEFRRSYRLRKEAIIWKIPLHTMHPDLEALSVVIHHRYTEADAETTSLSFYELNLNDNFKSLVVRGFETVEILNCSFPSLESLVIDGGSINIDLIEHMLPQTKPYRSPCARINVYGQLSQFEFNAPKLKRLFLRRNRQVTVIDLTKFPGLEELTVSNNMVLLMLPAIENIKTFDFSFNPRAAISIKKPVGHQFKLTHENTPERAVAPMLGHNPMMTRKLERLARYYQS